MPASTDRLLSRLADRARLQTLLARHWRLPSRGDHPLGQLQGRRLGPCRLLVLLGPKNSVGATYFQLYLIDRDGRLSRQPVILGLHNSGRYPGYNWFDLVRYDPVAAFDGERLDLRDKSLEGRLFRLLGGLIPPGGHLMVEYDSPGQRDSARILNLGYPAACSPLGYALFRAGCLHFRDWYIPEGGREGSRKLQGFKPLDERAAHQRAQEMAAELRRVLSQSPPRAHGEWGRTARRLARLALWALKRLPSP